MPIDDFIIRPAINADIAEVKRIVFNALREYGLQPDESGKDHDLNDIENNFFSANGFFGIAIEKNTHRPVGTFGLYKVDNSICELRKMYLMKEYRGQGLGQMMLENAIEMAKLLGYQKIVLETISPLKEAISLYMKYGFEEITPAYINDRVDQAFELNLTNPLTDE